MRVLNCHESRSPDPKLFKHLERERKEIHANQTRVFTFTDANKYIQKDKCRN